MVYISSFGKFPTPWPCFNSSQVFFVSSSISASSTSTGAREDDQPRFLSFLNIPMEVQKVHTWLHTYNKIRVKFSITKKHDETPKPLTKKTGWKWSYFINPSRKTQPLKTVSVGNPPLLDTSHTLDKKPRLLLSCRGCLGNGRIFKLNPKGDRIFESWDSLKLNDLLVRKNWAKHGWTMEQIVEIVAKFSPFFFELRLLNL